MIENCSNTFWVLFTLESDPKVVQNRGGQDTFWKMSKRKQLFSGMTSLCGHWSGWKFWPMRGLKSGYVTVNQWEAWKKSSPVGDKHHIHIFTHTTDGHCTCRKNRPRGWFFENPLLFCLALGKKKTRNIAATSLELYMSNSQILATWSFRTQYDIVPRIGEKLDIAPEFQQFSRNNKYIGVSGKL